MAAPESKPFEVALSYYDQLLPVIPVDEVLVKLIPKRIINLDDKQLIKAEKTSKKQAEYLLDNYILKRIQTGEDHILFILLEAMRESGKCDSLVKKIYKDLDMEPPAAGVCRISMALVQNDIVGEIKAGYTERFDQLYLEYATKLKDLTNDALSDVMKLKGDTIPAPVQPNESEAVVTIRDIGVQCDFIIAPGPIQHNYQLILIGPTGSGKSSAYRFFCKMQQTYFGSVVEELSHSIVIADNFVTLIDTFGFMNNEYDCVKERVRNLLLAYGGVHAVALVLDPTNRIDMWISKLLRYVLQDSELISSTFVLLTNVARIGRSDDEQRQQFMELQQGSDTLKHFMKQVGQRFIMLESEMSMGTSYHDKKSLELVTMIRKIYSNNNHRILTAGGYRHL